MRRVHFPTEPGYGGHGCDERVGRFCYWYDPFDEPAPEESKFVRRARERLLRDLTAASGRIPGDDWITGQLTRYLIEHGLTDSAIGVAQRCHAARWWCHALEGFAHHMARDYERADDAFERAVQEMPEAQRCVWTDLTILFGEDGRRYGRLPCEERLAAGERIWWLARPLYSRPGNDLRTEHYARHTMAFLLQEAATAEGLRWDDDMRELVLRFGWPTYWTRAFDQTGRAEPPPIIGHEPSPSFWLFPAPTITDPWADVTEIFWDPAMDRPPARYAPPYARGFGSIEQAQFARFRRGDTTLTVATFDLAGDSVFASRPADVRLAAALDPATPPVVGEAAAAAPALPSPRGIVTVRSPWRPAVLSLEAVAVDTPWVARQRAMASPDPGGAPGALSDILLFAPTDVLPESLEAALPSALTEPAAARDQRVGLYWEIYDSEIYGESDSVAAPIEITVTATKVDSKSDIPYPIGRPWCPLLAKSIRLRWQEEPDSRPPGPSRAVVLELRSLSRGRHFVTVQVSVAGQARGCSSRELQVR